MRSLSQGFSLIELMIVVSIMAILAMMALPSYHSYTERARFAEVITTTHVYQTAVALALQSGFDITSLSTGEHGIPPAPPHTQNLASLSVVAGVIHAESTQAAGSATLILTPNSDGSQWTLSGSCVSVGWCHG